MKRKFYWSFFPSSISPSSAFPILSYTFFAIILQSHIHNVLRINTKNLYFFCSCCCFFGYSRTWQLTWCGFYEAFPSWCEHVWHEMIWRFCHQDWFIKFPCRFLSSMTSPHVTRRNLSWHSLGNCVIFLLLMSYPERFSEYFLFM